MTVKNFIFLILCMTLSVVAMADWKQYAYTIDSKTPYAGEREVELYTDYQAKGGTYRLRTLIELEYGILSQLGVGVYGVLEQTEKSSYRYKFAKFEIKYRFGEQGSGVMDTALYAEYYLENDRANPDKIELKAIVEKTWSTLTWTGNLIYEQKLQAGVAGDTKFSTAVSMLVMPSLIGSLEMKGDFTGTKPTLFIAPGLSYGLDDIKVNLAVGVGLNSNSQDLYIRNIVSYEF